MEIFLYTSEGSEYCVILYCGMWNIIQLSEEGNFDISFNNDEFCKFYIQRKKIYLDLEERF